MTAVPITHQLVEQRFGSEADPTDQVTDLEDKMHQVFAVLIQVTEGEANDIVCNSSGMGLDAWEKIDPPMESPDWESPSKPPETCDHQSRKSKFDRIVGCIGALGGTGFEAQEFQEPTGTESRHTRGHLDSLGIVSSDRSEVHLQMNSSRFETYDAMRAEVLAFIESLEQVQG